MHETAQQVRCLTRVCCWECVHQGPGTLCSQIFALNRVFMNVSHTCAMIQRTDV